jgi:hypothetical protein
MDKAQESKFLKYKVTYLRLTLYTCDYFYKTRHTENRIKRAVDFRNMKPYTTIVKCRRSGKT